VSIGSRLKSALRTILHQQRVESELESEIRGYVDAVTDEKIASGVSPRFAISVRVRPSSLWCRTFVMGCARCDAILHLR
jgi:hypothetical protein